MPFVLDKINIKRDWLSKIFCPTFNTGNNEVFTSKSSIWPKIYRSYGLIDAKKEIISKYKARILY